MVMPRSHLAAAFAVAAALALPTAASAFRLPANLGPIARNPADKLSGMAIDDQVSAPATHATRMPHKGVLAALRWLPRHTNGISWGTYRCEKWGRGSASLHAEGRAMHWHPPTRADAAQLIDLLLAPDKAGNAHALARRMGVEELIWDCSYWSSGSEDFRDYDYCYGRNGKRRKHIDPTAAHMDHVHIGFSKAGA